MQHDLHLETYHHISAKVLWRRISTDLQHRRPSVCRAEGSTKGCCVPQNEKCGKRFSLDRKQQLHVLFSICVLCYLLQAIINHNGLLAPALSCFGDTDSGTDE